MYISQFSEIDKATDFFLLTLCDFSWLSKQFLFFSFYFFYISEMEFLLWVDEKKFG